MFLHKDTWNDSFQDEFPEDAMNEFWTRWVEEE